MSVVAEESCEVLIGQVIKTQFIPEALTTFAAPLEALMAIDARVQQRVAFEFSKVCLLLRALMFWRVLP